MRIFKTTVLFSHCDKEVRLSKTTIHFLLKNVIGRCFLSSELYIVDLRSTIVRALICQQKLRTNEKRCIIGRKSKSPTIVCTNRDIRRDEMTFSYHNTLLLIYGTTIRSVTTFGIKINWSLDATDHFIPFITRNQSYVLEERFDVTFPTFNLWNKKGV